ncbi:hypothetical protein EDD96_6662 [Streptomyces sp. Ag109_G2-6]|nr:hypothetical protein EDD96_6662 [Streptomyces sp. Ag109_G2-6]
MPLPPAAAGAGLRRRQPGASTAYGADVITGETTTASGTALLPGRSPRLPAGHGRHLAKRSGPGTGRAPREGRRPSQPRRGTAPRHGRHAGSHPGTHSTGCHRHRRPVARDPRRCARDTTTRRRRSPRDGRAGRCRRTARDPPAIHCLEVRADLAHVAGDAAGSCAPWMAAVDARLARHRAPDAPEAEAAVDRAHYQWQAVRDAARARELGPHLVTLRRRVPGQRPGATEAPPAAAPPARPATPARPARPRPARSRTS